MEETKHIKWTNGVKYVLEEDAWFYTGIMLDEPFITKRVIHQMDGWMCCMDGFPWDGCSGPTKDDQTNQRAGCAHDGGYYLLRHGFPQEHRHVFDAMLERYMNEDATYVYKGKRFARIRRWFFSKIRPAAYEIAVSKFAEGSADPNHKREVHVSP